MRKPPAVGEESPIGGRNRDTGVGDRGGGDGYWLKPDGSMYLLQIRGISLAIGNGMRKWVNPSRAEVMMVDPDEIAQIAESLRLIVLSVADAESDDRWQRAQAIVARHNDNETWQDLCDYAESKIEEHKHDQLTGEATAWRKVLGIIKGVP